MEQNENSSDTRLPVIFVPGAIMPGSMSYGPLLDVIKDQVEHVIKDLEVYATDQPPFNYSLELEVEGIRRAAEAASFTDFHLIGYSAGGAISLAFTAQYPNRLKSLALIEPAWIGNDDWTPEDLADWAALDRVMTLSNDERMHAFAVWQMRPGLEPHRLQIPAGPPPPWMAQRPAGLDALVHAFKAYHLNKEPYHSFRQPVYYAFGSLSRSFYERNAQTLASFFPNIRVELYEDRSHFDPPHRAEPERFAQALRNLWERS